MGLFLESAKNEQLYMKEDTRKQNLFMQEEGYGTGKDGKSAYEIWLEQGNEGTEEDFIESLKGKDGYTPQKGVDYFDGKDGYTPQKGIDYFDGKDGEDYILTEPDKEEIAEKVAEKVEIPDEYVTETELEAKGYQTKTEAANAYQPKGSYATTEQLAQTEAKIPTKVSHLDNDKKYLEAETDPTVPSWAKAASKPTYTKSEVGLGNVANERQYSANNPPPYPVTSVNGSTGDVEVEPKGTAQTKVTNHNADDEAHNDIRLLISALTKKVNDLLDSDDTTLDQMSEVVAYIKANRELLESYTTEKVNVADIIDNLTTSVSNKPLSAKQGVQLKALIDAIKVPTALSQLSGDSTHRTVTDSEKAAWDAKSDFSGSYTDLTNKPTIPTKLSDLTADATHRTVTDTEKSTWNAKSNFSGSYNDLTNKPTIPTVPTKVSAFENDAKYVTEADFAEFKNYVTPQMFGAVADGINDDTAAIQAALDASSFVYIPDGTYMINAVYAGYGHEAEGGLKPKSGQTVRISNNATLKAIPNASQFYHIINLFKVENVSICGGKIEGDRNAHTGTGGEWGHGIAIRACSNIVIDSVESFNCWGDSICMGYKDNINNTDIRIYNCKLHDSRRQGISLVGGLRVIIRDCEIYNINGTAPQYGIDIEPDGDVGIVENVVIDACYIHDCVGGSIVIAQVTEKIHTLRVSNCRLDTLEDLAGEDVIINNNSIRKITVASDFINIANCIIEHVVVSGGNGRFYNCQFINDTEAPVITSDLSEYPTRIVELVEFHGCYFRVSGSATYLIKAQSVELTNGIFPEKTIRFTSCKIEFCGTAANNFIVDRHPHELIMENCDVIFKDSNWAAFNLKNNWDTKLKVVNSRFMWNGTASYIIDGGTYSNYELEFYNNEFSPTRNFMYVSAGGTTGGTIRLSNNVMSNLNFYNKHNFTIIGSNTEAETIAKTLAQLPVYDGGVS